MIANDGDGLTVSVLSSGLVRTIKQIDGMYATDSRPGSDQARAYLHMTTGVPGRDERRFRRPDVLELGIEHTNRGLRLHEVVDPGATTAAIRVDQGHQVKSGNHAQCRQRRIGQPLRVMDVTGRVVGYA